MPARCCRATESGMGKRKYFVNGVEWVQKTCAVSPPRRRLGATVWMEFVASAELVNPFRGPDVTFRTNIYYGSLIDRRLTRDGSRMDLLMQSERWRAVHGPITPSGHLSHYPRRRPLPTSRPQFSRLSQTQAQTSHQDDGLTWAWRQELRAMERSFTNSLGSARAATRQRTTISLLFSSFPITPAPIGVRGAFAATTSTTIDETDVLDEAWAKLKAVGTSIGEAFDSVVASIKANTTTSASDLMEKSHEDDCATDEVSSSSDAATPTEAIVDPTVDDDEDANEDGDEAIAILEGDCEDTSMLEGDGVFDACDAERIKRVFATAARVIMAALKAAFRWLAALLLKPQPSNAAAAKAKATAKAALKAKAKLTEWIGSEKFQMLVCDDDDEDWPFEDEA